MFCGIVVPEVPLLRMVATLSSSRSFLLELASKIDGHIQKWGSLRMSPAPGSLKMVRLLLPLLWAGEWLRVAWS